VVTHIADIAVERGQEFEPEQGVGFIKHLGELRVTLCAGNEEEWM
jgi:hypothetical protein